ncbi:Aminopeptidase N [Anthophora quadrimaculata]
MTRTSISLLLVLTICQANLLLGNSIDTQADNSNKLNYILPKDSEPLEYVLVLEPDLKNFTFAGKATIRLNVATPTNSLTLNAKNLGIKKTDVTLATDKNVPITITNVELLEKQEFLVIEVQNKLPQGVYVLTIEYTGELNDQKRGFYRSRYIDKNGSVQYVAATHFEPTGARQAFPCYDEPAYKAIFKISLIHSKKYSTVIGNMPTLESVDTKNDTVKTTFKATKPMSSYLVAFVVSDYGGLTNKNKTFGVWTKPHAVSQTKHALEVGEELLNKLNSYTNLNYFNYIEKMDQVTLKDFAPSAMENWGLVTYRETALLYEEGVTTTRTKQSITTVIAHEFTHQWFGNLVSPAWWKYVWLNEGFANYFQYFITNEVYPEWRLNEVLVVDSMQGNAFVADAAEKVRPMNKDVESPEEISVLFDSIAYQKAGSVIRMMSHILTENVFKNGLRAYLKNKALSSATSEDLLKALGEAANTTWEGAKFDKIMDEWVNKPGYPVVNVRRNNKTLVLSQERFTLYGTKDETKWWVPITYFKKTNLNDTATKPVAWLQPNGNNLTINYNNTDGWIVVNSQQAGYYRVNYDEENWKLLTEYLRSSEYKNLHVLNRAQLIDDSLNLARTNRLNYTVALSLSLYLRNEVDYIPWQAALRNLNFLHNMLRTSDRYDSFKLYVKYLLKGLTKNVTYAPQKNDTDITKLLKTNAMKWACRADVEECTNYANEQFKLWIENTTKSLDVDWKNNILCAGLRSANNDTWNRTLNNILSTTQNDEDERKSLFPVLTCSNSKDQQEKYLLSALEKNATVSFDAAIQHVVSEHPEGVNIALQVLTTKLDIIKKLDKAEDVIKSCAETIGNSITNEEQFIQLSFFMANEEVRSDVLQSTTLKAKRNIEWLHAHKNTIENWLIEHESEFNSGNSLVFTSFLFILSIFITRFY